MKVDRALLLLLAVALVAYIGWNELRGRPQPGALPDIVGTASVIDGDTIIIHGMHIRLVGIDAPESGQSCEADGAKYLCGQKAAFVLYMLKDKTVTCQRTYKRPLARCFVCVAKGRQRCDTDIQSAMVRQGWAITYRRYSKDYVADEDAAHQARLGIWAGTFVEPEIWRHNKSARN